MSTIPRILYIGDWHYGHRNIIGYDNRPFGTIDEMDQTLTDNWNKAVRPDDTVYVLGDMFWRNRKTAAHVLDRLRGSKILIKGNHDDIRPAQLASRFKHIADYLEIQDENRHVVLCHYPMPYFRNQLHGWTHLYAHVHNTPEFDLVEHQKKLIEELYGKPCRMFNAGAMMPWMDYTPRTLDEIETGYAKYTSGQQPDEKEACRS